MSISRLTMISRDRHVVDEHVVEALLDLVGVDPLAHRQVALRVEVDAEHAVAGLGEGDGEVEGRRRLRDAALLVGEGDHVGVLDRRLRLGLARSAHEVVRGWARSGRPPSSAPSLLVLGLLGSGSTSVDGSGLDRGRSRSSAPLRRVARMRAPRPQLARTRRRPRRQDPRAGRSSPSRSRPRIVDVALGHGFLHRWSSSTIGCCSSTGRARRFGLRLRNPIARIFGWGPAFPAGPRNC